ncbi:hypothetical protein LBMAG56_29030 [Verrucomicrobiota bacterium]|nr:hypothetical protein LBMAG56_29030 [Verrucomicrobiota bacterium]
MADREFDAPFPRRGALFYLAVTGLIGAGLAVLLFGWIIPANVKSIDPLLLKKAAQDSRTIIDEGLRLVNGDRVGPAQFVLATATQVGHTNTALLANAIADYQRRRPELAPWGGYDPQLEQVFNLRESALTATNQPIIPILIPEKNRATVARHLVSSKSGPVASIFATRAITNFAQFAPALGPGGQPLDATILMIALLSHSGHLAGKLNDEVKSLADAAGSQPAQRQTLEIFYLDLLSLGKRLNWMQIAELLKVCTDVRTVHFFAEQAKTSPESFAVIYTAAIVVSATDRLPHPDQVAALITRFGRTSVGDLTFALNTGVDALTELLRRQVPIRAAKSGTFDPLVTLSLNLPKTAVFLKLVCFLLGVAMMVHGTGLLFPPTPGVAAAAPAMPIIRTGTLALGICILLVLASEPFLFTKGPRPEYQFEIAVPGSPPTPVSAPLKPTPTKPVMDITTIFSIVLFLLIQIFVYIVCLTKISEIDGQPAPPLLKLKLVENEENLFDTGLYVGIGGTAAALVLQVMNVIDANLLAAYSSNLLGIVCVALVKIRHVRPFKRKLIMEAAGEANAEATLETAARTVGIHAQ